MWRAEVVTDLVSDDEDRVDEWGDLAQAGAVAGRADPAQVSDTDDGAIQLPPGQQMRQAAAAHQRSGVAVVPELFEQRRRLARSERIHIRAEGDEVRRDRRDADLAAEDAVDDVHPQE